MEIEDFFYVGNPNVSDVFSFINSIVAKHRSRSWPFFMIHGLGDDVDELFAPNILIRNNLQL